MRLKCLRPWYLASLAALLWVALAFGGPVAVGALWLWLALGAVDAAWAGLAGGAVGVLLQVRGTAQTAGDPMEIELTIGNDGRLAIPLLTVRDGPTAIVGMGTGRTPLRCCLVPGEQMRFQRTQKARRGRYRVGPLDVVIEGPFGLFAAVRSVQSEQELMVQPRLRPLPRWPLVQAESWGPAAGAASPYRNPTLPVTTRPMLPGDSPRWIHWKQTARTGRLQVREAEPATGGHTVLILDLDAAAYRGQADGTADAAVELAASIGHAALRAGCLLSVASTGQQPLALRAQSGPASVAALLELLSVAAPDGQTPLDTWLARPPIPLPTRTQVVVVTPSPPDRWAAAVRGAGSRFAAVLVGDAPALDRGAAGLRRLGSPAWVADSSVALAEQLGGSRAGVVG